ncbi:hypothetical protein ACROYT_G005416 [Oculina patagonica]
MEIVFIDADDVNEDNFINDNDAPADLLAAAVSNMFAPLQQSRKHKQNDRKARGRRKGIRLENGRKAVFQKIAPDVGTEEVMGLTTLKVDKGDLIIEELEGLAKREVKILSDILEAEVHFITDEARKFILDY